MGKFSEPNRPLSLVDTYRRERRRFEAKRDRALRDRLNAVDLENIDILDGDSEETGLTVFLAANNRARLYFAQLLSRQVSRIFAAIPDQQFLHITIINPVFETSEHVTDIDLTAMTKQARHILDATGANWIAGVEFAMFANRRHPDGGRVVSPHVHATLWGHAIHERAKLVAKRYNLRLGTSVRGMKAVKVQRVRATRRDVERVLTYPYLPPSRTKTVYFNPRNGRTNIHESERADRYVGYLRMWQLLTLIEQDRLCFAGRDGKVVRRRALRAVHDRLERVTPHRARAQQMKWVEEFWAGFIPRMRLKRFTTPQITLR